MDHAAYEQRLGKPCNARGLSMIWRSDKFDQVDEYGQPAARGIDGQLLRPQAYITRFLKRCESEIPDADAVRPRVGGQDERV
jgi:hypothetical protein